MTLRDRASMKQPTRAGTDQGEQLTNLMRQLRQCPFLKGELHEDVAVATAATATVRHRLGHTPKIVMHLLTVGTDNRIHVVSKTDKQIIVGNAGAADATVTLWLS